MTRPVPVADSAIDRRGRLWTCWQFSLNPFDSQWECPKTGGGATWAQLDGIAHGPVVAFDSREFGVSA